MADEFDAIWGTGKWGSFKWGVMSPPPEAEEGLIFPTSGECFRFANTSRNITLCHVINYRTMKKTSIPFHRVVDKQGSSLDRDARTTTPLRLTVGARITNTQKETLDLMETDREVIDITLGDLLTSYPNYTLESLEFKYNFGYADNKPWIVTMQFLASND